jgi:hypothetical protein
MRLFHLFQETQVCLSIDKVSFKYWVFCVRWVWIVRNVMKPGKHHNDNREHSLLSLPCIFFLAQTYNVKSRYRLFATQEIRDLTGC